MTNAAAESHESRERHATNLELFLDLAFVFAVTQITSFVAANLSWQMVGRGSVIAFLTWWMWSQYTWAGAAVDLQRWALTRVLVLITIPATLVVAASIPTAFTSGGAWFGIAYLAVQLLVLAMQGVTAVREEATRRSFLRYASAAAIMPVVVAVGGFLDGNGRLIAWCVAAGLCVAGALLAASGEWVIDPVHFCERHALFVIISLGETLVAIGATASAAGLTGKVFAGLTAASAYACVMWWIYFAYIPDVVEAHLRSLDSTHRGVAARDLFTFGHFPLVAGIIAFAIVAKHTVADAAHSLALADRVMLAASVMLVVGSLIALQWRVARRIATERVVAIPTALVLVIGLRSLPAAALVAVIAALLLVMHLVTWRRVRPTVSAPTQRIPPH